MKLNALTISAITAITFLSATSPALSADEYRLPAEVTRGEVRYITGGVGSDAAAAFKQAAARYPLELQFVRKATPMDEFLSGVKVTIKNRAGAVVLDATSEGPYLLAQLPAGTYQIDADHAGVTKRQALEIRAGRHERAVFVWAAGADTAPSGLPNTK